MKYYLVSSPSSLVLNPMILLNILSTYFPLRNFMNGLVLRVKSTRGQCAKEEILNLMV